MPETSKISFIHKYPTLRFLKYALLALAVQVILIAIFLFLMFTLDVRDPGPIGMAVIWIYLWPLLVLPQGHGHGGELFFMPVTAVFYAFIYGIVMAIIRRPKT